MARKSKTTKGKKRRASTGININIKNVLKQNIGDRTRQTPDFIRPLGQRPIESQAYDNRYRLQNPSVTYMSTPLANMPSLRDIVNAPALPQVSGQPRALRPDILQIETNPNDLAPSKGSIRGLRSAPPLLDLSRTSTPLRVQFSPQSTRAMIADLQLQRTSTPRRPLYLPSVAEVATVVPSISKASAPVVAQRLEPLQADESQLLVANQLPGLAPIPSPARPRRRIIVESPPRSTTVRPVEPARIAPLKGLKKVGAAAKVPALSIDA